MAETQAAVLARNPPDLVQLIMADLEFVADDLRAKPINSPRCHPTNTQAYGNGDYPLYLRGLKLNELEGAGRR
jgi:hypothetical protein